MKQRAYRRKAVDGEGEGDGREDGGKGEGEATAPAPASAAKTKQVKEKQKDRPQRAATLLSFGDEEDHALHVPPPSSSMQGAGRSKKSSAASAVHTVNGRKDRSAPVDVAPVASVVSNIRAQAGEYTAEKLAELAKNAIRVGAPVIKPLSAAEPNAILIKGGFKPAGSSSFATPTAVPVRPTIAEPAAELDSDALSAALPPPPRLTSASAADVVGGIPDAATIAALKAKRERMRAAGGAADYISLSGPGRGLQDSDRKNGEELDDSDAEDREDVVRRPFGKEASTTAASSAMNVSAMDGSSGVLEAEDEDEAWEMEQMRKAAAHENGASATPAVATAYGASNLTAAAARRPAAASIQGEAVLDNMRRGLARLQDTHKSAKASLKRTEEGLSAAIEAVDALNLSLSQASDKYVYVQELKAYIADLCDCLKDKAPLVEELEEQLRVVHEERALARLQRRAADEAEELAEATAGAEAAVSATARGASTSAAAAAAAASAAVLSMNDNLPPELDEFGRDLNLQRRQELQRRRVARLRRRERSRLRRQPEVQTANGGVTLRWEGESSSEESEGEVEAFNSTRKEVLSTSRLVFSDAADEFGRLPVIKRKLEAWKCAYPQTYRDAYASMSVPTIFSPFVRVELLSWSPIHDSTKGPPGFDHMEWYKELFDYGLHTEGAAKPDPDDADSELVPHLVEHIAVPAISYVVEKCWDPRSVSQSEAVSAAVKELLIYVPAESDAMQEVLNMVRSRLTQTIAEFVLPAWPPAALAASPTAGALSARRFGNALKLLRSLLLWEEVLAESMLRTLLLHSLLSSKMIPHLRAFLPAAPADALSRAERVAAAISIQRWFADANAQPLLAPFAEFLAALAKCLEHRQERGAGEAQGMARRLMKLLTAAQDHDRAKRLGRVFGISD
eukprot:jgi/Chlat1/4250/Chrsp27S04319